MGRRARLKQTRKQIDASRRHQAAMQVSRTLEEAVVAWLTGGSVPIGHCFLAGERFCIWSPERRDLLLMEVCDGDPDLHGACRDYLLQHGAAFGTVEEVRAEARRRGLPGACTMTDAEWNSCTDPGKMLEFLRTTGRATERRLRLFAVGCCQRVRAGLYTRNSSQAVLVAEQYADQLAGTEQLTEARLLVRNDLELHPGEPEYDASYWACSSVIGEDIGTCACYAVACSTQQLDYKSDDFDDRCQALAADEKSMQAHLLRDIFGNPLRPASPIHPAWLAWQDGTVPKLAASVYEERQLPSGHLDPARLAILADALEEAGCADRELLGHLRSEGPHVRGCFALDLLLGKS